TADSWALRFHQCDLDVGTEGAIHRVGYFEYTRQCTQQWVVRSCIAPEETADKAHRLRRSAPHGNSHRQLELVRRTVAADIVLAAQSWCAREHMSVAVGDDHHVPRVQKQWSLTGDGGPAGALRDGVIADQIFGSREHPADDLLPGRRLGRPRI